MPEPDFQTAGMKTALPPSGRRPWEGLGLLIIAAVIIGAYAYLSTVRLGNLFIFKQHSEDYYAYLVDGFRHGQLAMRVEAPPAFATLANPYDPAARAQIGEPGLHDATYYHGRYYLYFGPAPALVLFWPFRALTGVHFPSELASVLFCAGGYVFSLGLFLGLRRRYFPACGTGTVWLAAILFGLGNFCSVMLTRNAVWEVPISCAYCFSCLGYWLLFLACEKTPRSTPCLLLASVAFGLAVASRPHFIFCGAVIGALWLWDWRARSRSAGKWEWRPCLREGAALFLPLGLMVAGLLLYNYERFGQLFEFGQKYQIGGNDQSHMKMLGPKFFPVNFYCYFLAPAQFQRYFPFFEVIRGYRGARPEGYLGSEDPYGLLTNMPFSWLALAAPLVWVRRFRDRRAIGSWMSLFGLCFVVLAGTVLSFPGSTNRYMVDFLPTLQLLAALGLLMLSSLDGLSRWGRRLLRLGLVGAVAYTAVFNVFVAFAHNGVFQAHRPEAYHRLEVWFDRPVMAWEKWRGQPFGPVEMTVRFPPDRLTKVEPLLVTGAAFRSDYVYIYYGADGRSVQLGYTRTNYEQQLSQPIPVDFNVPHRIGIRSGTLYPRAFHPYFADWTPAQVQSAKHTLEVTLDGVPYLAATHNFFETGPGFITVGRNDLSDYIGPKFTGEILDVRRQALKPAVAPFAGGGFVRLAFVLPSGTTGRREPLIATGTAGAGDLIFAVYDDATHIRLGWQHAGAPAVLSEPLAVVPAQVQLLEASLGSFYPHPENADERELAKALIVRFNGRLVWAEPDAFYPPGASAPSLFVNPWPSAAVAGAFSGRRVAVQPMPSLMPSAGAAPFIFAPYWLEAGAEPGYGALRFHVDFPRGESGKFEPLLVSGPSVSQADYLWIRYQETGSDVIVGYEHTSGGGPNSGAFPLDLSRPHVIEISLPSLYPPQGDPYFAGLSLLGMLADKSSGQIKVDGVLRIDGPVKSYESTPAQATPGENDLSNTFGRRFTGRITQKERSLRQPPPGFAGQTGPLEMMVTWPTVVPVGQREALLATGDEKARDALLVSYDDVEHARLIVQTHDGKSWASLPWKIRAAGDAILRIGWGGFFTEAARPPAVAAADWEARQRAFAIEGEGEPVFAGKADFSLQNPQAVSIGSAPGSGTAFSGLIRSLARLAPEKP